MGINESVQFVYEQLRLQAQNAVGGHAEATPTSQGFLSTVWIC